MYVRIFCGGGGKEVINSNYSHPHIHFVIYRNLYKLPLHKPENEEKKFNAPVMSKMLFVLFTKLSINGMMLLYVIVSNEFFIRFK